jgi:hypothetical protein
VLAPRARAETRAALIYHVPAGCPPEPEFVSSVRARGGRFEGVAPEARARSLEVTVRSGTQGFEGSLQVEDATGASAVREVHAAECSEVVKGLAVVAAIALGGEPSNEAPADAPAVEPSEASTPALVSPKPVPPAHGRRELDPRKAEQKPRLRGNSFDRVDTVEVERGKMRFDRAHTYTLAGGVQFGLVPVVLPRVEFTVGTANFVTPPSGSSYLVGPILQVEWDFFGPGTFRTGDFSTDIWGSHVAVLVCSAFIYDAEAFSLSACGEFGGGYLRLNTRGASTAATVSKNTGFGATGLALDAMYAIGGVFHVGFRVGGQLQFGPITAERPDGTELFKSSIFGGYATLGLGLHF